MKRKFNVFIAALMSCVFIAALLTAFLGKRNKVISIKTTEGGKPLVGETLDIVLPDANDAEGQKALAYRLYLTANENMKNMERYMLSVNSLNTSAGIPVYGFRNQIRNADEMFYIEYSFVIDDGGKFLLGLFAEESTMFAERRYSNAGTDVMYCQKVLTPELSFNDGTPVFNANWNKVFSETTMKKQDFGPDAVYEQTDQKIDMDTIQSAKVTYNKDGYYEVEVRLDVNEPKTTAITIESLKKGSGASDAHYTSMVETFHVWDNGYYKYFRSVDDWEGTMPFIGVMKSQIDFETNFFYDDEHTNFANCKYATEYIESVKAEHNK